MLELGCMSFECQMFVYVHGKTAPHLVKGANNNAMLPLIVIVIATVLVKSHHSALTTLYSHSEISIEILC